MGYDVDEALANGLRYTEELGSSEHHGPFRCCALWSGTADLPVSSLRLYPLRVRFGAVALSAEGCGGVQTPVEHRGRGYARALLERAVEGASTRARAMFLFGIEGLYGKLGFVSCLPESSLSVRVARAECAASGEHAVDRLATRDLPAAASLYNAAHAIRPWTLVRDEASSARLARPGGWHPGPEVLTTRRGGELRGYAAMAGLPFGHLPRSLTVTELAAADEGAAESLLREIARLAWERRIDTFLIQEPPDGAAGRVAKRLGCEVRQVHSPDGGGMARILDRKAVLEELAPELARREGCAESGAPSRSAEGHVLEGASWRVLGTLASASGGVSDAALVRLLLGHWSWEDGERQGLVAPAGARRTFVRWFPGASATLPTAHAHELDRY